MAQRPRRQSSSYKPREPKISLRYLRPSDFRPDSGDLLKGYESLASATQLDPVQLSSIVWFIKLRCGQRIGLKQLCTACHKT
jgi:hypothetical protein